MIAIPLVALLVAGSMSTGGFDAVLLTLERGIRQTVTAGLEFVTRLF
jgi:hypothetical protein